MRIFKPLLPRTPVMDKQEAINLLNRELGRYSQMPHSELQKFIDEDCSYTVKGVSGNTYQVKINVLWDHVKEKSDIRIIGSIDDGRFWSLTTYFPLTQSALVSDT